MSEVIVVTSGKGGVGKTTTTANIGVGLSLLGKKVVLIDTDIGLRNLDVILGQENRVVYDLVDVINGECDLKRAVIQDKRFEGLFLIPAAQTTDKDAVSPAQMKELCKKLKEEYDFVVIDCPAGIEQGFKNAIAGADKAVVVTTPDVSAVRDADRIVGLLEQNGIVNHKVIINKIRPELVRRGEMLGVEEVLGMLSVDLLGVIPDDGNVIASAMRGEPVVCEKKSLAGQGYRNICERLTGKDVQLLKLEKRGFFRKKTKKKP